MIQSKMKMLSVFILTVCCLGYTWPDTVCSFSPSTASLECSVAQLQGDTVYSGSLASAERARNIKIVCSDDQAYQSVIQHNQFGHLHNLSKLEIEMCASLDMRRGAFQGLQHLQTIKVLS